VTIALVGGGSGGHITPLLAVAQELKKQQPDVKLAYIGEKGGKFFDIAQTNQLIQESYAVSAGKFRRYYSKSKLAQIFDIKTNLLNARDAFRVARGYRQSLKLLRNMRPDVVFIKGGFVAVPVGKACAKLGIPYLTHDSDTVPGLANRLIAKNAFLHTVGMPKEFYDYPPDKTEVVGIPLAKEYTFITPELLQQYRNYLKLPQDAQVIFVTGGSLGAQRLNMYMGLAAPDLLGANPKLHIIHQVGKGNLGTYNNVPAELRSRIQEAEYFSEMFYYSGAADVVVSRAGATTIAEFALQGKAIILVPNPYLTSGHQLTNAKRLSESGAAEVIHESNLDKDYTELTIALKALVENDSARQALATHLHALAHPDAAQRLAEILFETIEFTNENKKA
jgi:UDP-N-acetylglucosamine--N-acetylmuramyl-(pentapeptide) pyrophosphoryl-undecaprenol N-acetylglucosamine transferase